MDVSTWAILNAKDRPICDYVGITECSLGEQSQVLTEPIEGGALAMYNKVQSPDVVTIALAISGDPSIQSKALQDLRALKNAIGRDSLCMLVTPFFVVNDLALETISQSRAITKNATSLVVELSFVRVRSVSTASQKVAWSPKNPTSADPSNGGRVQGGESTLDKMTGLGARV